MASEDLPVGTKAPDPPKTGHSPDVPESSGDEAGGTANAASRRRSASAGEPGMIHTHEAALLRIADLRHQAAAERRAREHASSSHDRESREEAESRVRTMRRKWSPAA
ncbi:hypothetical protein GCM10012287_23010 [Streptomyces daqingensis]|uniref:Uncharacterized protein n=2 Tax=Streptomyces daqingensis TaxID=1472640 RepID=A0ABQ2M8X4_9ACTN|nr:hypothetical protein GCM10012287_23010 [Streptomyces daqingensis]